MKKGTGAKNDKKNPAQNTNPKTNINPKSNINSNMNSNANLNNFALAALHLSAISCICNPIS